VALGLSAAIPNTPGRRQCLPPGQRKVDLGVIDNGMDRFETLALQPKDILNMVFHDVAGEQIWRHGRGSSCNRRYSNFDGRFA